MRQQEDIRQEIIDFTTNKRTQLIRLVGDGMIIAPTLIVSATQKVLPSGLRIVLLAIGIMTFTYNIARYTKIQRMVEELKRQNEIK